MAPHKQYIPVTREIAWTDSFFTLSLEMLKHHPSAPEDATADRPEPSQKRHAYKSSTELLAVKLAEGNDAPWEGMGCALVDF